MGTRDKEYGINWFCSVIDLLNDSKALEKCSTDFKEYYLANILQETEKLANGSLYSMYRIYKNLLILKDLFDFDCYSFMFEWLIEYVTSLEESEPQVLKYLIILLNLYPREMVLKFLDRLVEYFDNLCYIDRRSVIACCFKYLSEYRKEFFSRLLNNTKLGLSSLLDEFLNFYNTEEFYNFVKELDIPEQNKRIINFIYICCNDPDALSRLSRANVQIDYDFKENNFKIQISFGKYTNLSNIFLTVFLNILKNISSKKDIKLEEIEEYLSECVKNTAIYDIYQNGFKYLIFDIYYDQNQKKFNVFLNNKPLFTGNPKIDEKISKLFEQISYYLKPYLNINNIKSEFIQKILENTSSFNEQIDYKELMDNVRSILRDLRIDDTHIKYSVLCIDPFQDTLLQFITIDKEICFCIVCSFKDRFGYTSDFERFTGDIKIESILRMEKTDDEIIIKPCSYKEFIEELKELKKRVTKIPGKFKIIL